MFSASGATKMLISVWCVPLSASRASKMTSACLLIDIQKIHPFEVSLLCCHEKTEKFQHVYILQLLCFYDDKVERLVKCLY